MQNIKRDPFEQFVTFDGKSAMNFGGSLGAPSTGLSVHIRHSAVWSAVVADAPGDVQSVPAVAGSGDLQPHAGSGAGQEWRQRRRVSR
jgi:hypothetical protein